MAGYLLCKAVIDGEERISVITETALPHMPQWTTVDPDDVRPNSWDFEEPEDAAPVAPPPAVLALPDRIPSAPRRAKPTGDTSADTPKE